MSAGGIQRTTPWMTPAVPSVSVYSTQQTFLAPSSPGGTNLVVELVVAAAVEEVDVHPASTSAKRADLDNGASVRWLWGTTKSQWQRSTAAVNL